MTTRFLSSLNPSARHPSHRSLGDRFYGRLKQGKSQIKGWWQRQYAKWYEQLRFYQFAALLGGFELQYALLPHDLSHLIQQIIVIQTTDIQWGGRPPREYRKQGFRITSGNWDLCCKEPIESYLDSDIYCRSIRQLFIEGRAIEDTDQYKQMTQRLAAGEIPKGCQSLQEIYICFENLFQAYETIKTEGYKNQTELNSGNPHDEIMVYVDRNGEFHKQQGSGHHRLALARLLNIPEVPVCVLGIHKQWASQCYAQYGKNIIFAVNQGLQQKAIAAQVKPLK